MGRNLNRKRGAILTATGESKLQAARQASEQQHNFGERYTKEQLSVMLGLSYKTVAKIFGGGFAATGNRVPVDKQSLDLCFAAFNLTLEPQDYLYPETAAAIDPVVLHQTCDLNPALDCGEAPDVSDFYGRAAELAQLEQWVAVDRCRSIGILGMGGMGKTALATKLASQIYPNFAAVAWRSLRHAPPLANLLPKLIEIFSDRVELVPPTLDIATQISCLLHYMSDRRCLLILDNLETILHAEREGKPEAAGYTELFDRIGKSQHQSCLLFTSREKPEIIVSLEGAKLPVRTLVLAGLSVSESAALFDKKALSASIAGQSQLVANYSGNPLALNIVSTTISDLFDGDIDAFLDTNVTIFSDIRHLLDQQFDLLSALERAVMYWLAIAREWLSLNDLYAALLPAISKVEVLEAVESLSRKSLIEHRGGEFTQQAVVMEYVTLRFIARIVTELADRDIGTTTVSPLPLWLSHPLMTLQAPEYIHDIQKRTIVAPIASQLITQFGNRAALERQLKAAIVALQAHDLDIPHYGGGNAIDLLQHLEIDLTGYNFADLPIWQADLQSAKLHAVNFSGADLAKSLFTSSFGWISAVAFSPDSRQIVTGEFNGNLRLWQTSGTNSPIDTFTGHTDAIWSISVSPNGRVVASASQDATVRLWDLATRRAIQILQVDSAQILSVCFHPQGHLLATGHGNGRIGLWSVTTGEIVNTFAGHDAAIYSLRFNPDGTLLATGGDDNLANIWDVSTGNCLETLTVASDRVRSVRFSPNGELLAIGASNGRMQILECEHWQVVTEIATTAANWMFSLCFSPDSQMLAAGYSHSEVRVWSLSRSQSDDLGQNPIEEIVPATVAILPSYRELVSSLQFSPDGKLLLTGAFDRSIRLWDTTNWQELNCWQGYANRIDEVTFAPDGTKLVSGSQDGIVRVWDVSTGNMLQTLTGHREGLLSVDYSPNGDFIASSSATQVKVWNARMGTLLQTLSVGEGSAIDVRFSPGSPPDRQLLLASSSTDNIIRLWSATTGELIGKLAELTSLARSIAFSPDGKLLAAACFDSCWRLWDVETRQLLGCYLGHTNWIWDIAFSPDGRALATTSADLTARVWDVSTGRQLQLFAGHTQGVLAVKFSPDGRQLATGSNDRSIKIWDLETGELLQTLTGHLDRVLSLSYSPDSQLLASGSADETIKFWDLDLGTCIRTCKPPPPYQDMNITGVTGLTPATIAALKTLGAIENHP